MKKYIRYAYKNLVFFGSFSPFHDGHRQLALNLSQRYEDSKCYFVLTPNNPHKDKNNLLPFELRLKMLKNGIKTFKSMNIRYEISTIEEDMPVPNYTYLTLSSLTNIFGVRPTVVIGLDAFNSLPKWKNYEELKKYPYCVFGRNGGKIEVEGLNVEAFIEFDNPLSSTQIRTAFKNNDMYSDIQADLTCSENFNLLKRHYNLNKIIESI